MIQFVYVHALPFKSTNNGEHSMGMALITSNYHMNPHNITVHVNTMSSHVALMGMQPTPARRTHKDVIRPSNRWCWWLRLARNMEVSEKIGAPPIFLPSKYRIVHEIKHPAIYWGPGTPPYS